MNIKLAIALDQFGLDKFLALKITTRRSLKAYIYRERSPRQLTKERIERVLKCKCFE